MTAVLFRTGSGPIHSSLSPALPRFSVPVLHHSFSAGDKVEVSPFKHLEVNNISYRISRAISEPQAIIRLRSITAVSQTFPQVLSEVEESSSDDDVGGIGSLKFAEKCFDPLSWMPSSGIAVEGSQFSGFGSGSGRDGDGFGAGGSSGGSNNDSKRNKIGEYYQQMLKSNPNDPLLLRNYGKFLHEVEADTVKAEEYYGRAILACPGDGELLSLYGKLIWDTQREGERAKFYFDQAVSTSPHDCMVMGSYAQFMWEAEEDETNEEVGSTVSVPAAKPMVAAF